MRASLLLACVLLVLAVPRLASGQPQSGHASGFKLYSGGLAAGVDSSIITEEATLEDTVFSVVPAAIAYRSTTGRRDLQLIYEPAFDVYATHRALNAWNHAAAAAYSLDVTRDFGLRTGASFLRTQDRSRYSPGLTVSPRGLYVEGRAYFSADYRFSPDTSVTAHVGSSHTQTAVARSTSAAGSIDELTSSFTASLSRRFGSRHRISLGYSHLVSTLLNPGDLPPEQNVVPREGQDTLNLGYALSFLSGLRLAASAGTIRLPQEEGEDQYTYSYSANIDKSWRTLTIGAHYTRSLAGLLQLDATDPSEQIRDPLLSRSVAEQVYFTLAGELGRRLRVDYRLGLSRTGLPPSDEQLESVFSALHLGFVVVDRIVSFVNLEYWDQSATELILPVSRTRITTGLRFYWDSPPPGRGRREQETTRAILPVRRVR